MNNVKLIHQQSTNLKLSKNSINDSFNNNFTSKS